jgi:uncharacterized protein YjiS (DUF1127 family)
MRQIDPQLCFALILPALATTAGATIHGASAPAAPGRGLYWVLRRLRHVLDTLRLWQDRARGREQLRTFDDHLLRDIGLTRLQAEAEADKPFWRA